MGGVKPTKSRFRNIKIYWLRKSKPGKIWTRQKVKIHEKKDWGLGLMEKGGGGKKRRNLSESSGIDSFGKHRRANFVGGRGNVTQTWGGGGSV